MSAEPAHDHLETGEEVDEACAVAHGDLVAPAEDRRLIVVFSSPVGTELAHMAAHVGFAVSMLEPDPARSTTPWRRVGDAGAADLDARTDVVVTDHDRAELGDVLAAVLRARPRWVGVMGSPRHPAPHLPALRERGVAEADIARVHRPIGLDIGSHTPPEIAISTVAGLLADRNGRAGGVYESS